MIYLNTFNGKRIICIEGLDCVGKTTIFNSTKNIIQRNTNPILHALNYNGNIIFEHFPTDGSEARRIRKTEKNIDEEKLQSLMLEDLVNRTDKFFNQDKESVMICDRYLFSNYIHSFNMTSVSEFLNTLSGYWAQKNLPMYDIFVKNCLTTIVVSIPEDVRLKRMFFNRSESERDSNENEIYQQKLYDRYYNIMSHDRYQLDKAFNIQLYYPKINDSIL